MPKSLIRSQPKGFLESCELHRAADRNLSELLTRKHDSDAAWWSDPSCFCLSALTATSQRFPAGIRCGITTSGHVIAVFICSFSPELWLFPPWMEYQRKSEPTSPWQSEKSAPRHWPTTESDSSKHTHTKPLPTHTHTRPLHTHGPPVRCWENVQQLILCWKW